MKTDVVIVGAGFAGASTAYHLSQSFQGSILMIEKEEVPGFHASGRNAALVLQSTEIPEIRRAIAASRSFYVEHRQEVGFRACGSFLLGKKESLERVREPGTVYAEYLDTEEVRRRIPLLEGHNFEAALWTPSDGVIDVSALLHFYLEKARSRGVSIWLNCELTKVSRAQDAYRLKTSRGTIEATYLVNAAGAWASRIVELAGACRFPLFPLKRHLFVLAGLPDVDPAWPFIWAVDRNFYFRPETGDLLFSVCDEEATDSLEPTVNPEISEVLAELIWDELPGLRDAVQKRIWSCFRTKTPDGRFVVGWDPSAKGFFWAAGLSGHGVGASWQLGRLAAEKFLKQEPQPLDPFEPSRLTLQPS